jgi:hypothetical protein
MPIAAVLSVFGAANSSVKLGATALNKEPGQAVCDWAATGSKCRASRAWVSSIAWGSQAVAAQMLSKIPHNSFNSLTDNVYMCVTACDCSAVGRLSLLSMQTGQRSLACSVTAATPAVVTALHNLCWAGHSWRYPARCMVDENGDLDCRALIPACGTGASPLLAAMPAPVLEVLGVPLTTPHTHFNKGCTGLERQPVQPKNGHFIAMRSLLQEVCHKTPLSTHLFTEVLCACCDVLVQLVEGSTASNAKPCHKRRQSRPQRHL